MMYSRKASSFGLVVGLMVLISSCREQVPALKLVTSKTFTNYPSASAIEFYNGNIYIFGDDAPYMLVLDTLFRIKDRVQYIADTAYRISKESKKDIESAAILNIEGKGFLLAMGSFSTPSRKSLYTFDLDNPHKYFKSEARISFHGTDIREVNIEGLTQVKKLLVMANRANHSHITNQLIICSRESFNEVKPDVEIIKIELPLKSVAGISGLYYYEQKDILFFSASEEDTPSATEDGMIHDSYIGWIDHFSQKMKTPDITITHLMKLSDADKRFNKQKIESLCVEKTSGKDYFLFLAADNDNGQSTMFRVQLHLP